MNADGWGVGFFDHTGGQERSDSGNDDGGQERSDSGNDDGGQERSDSGNRQVPRRWRSANPLWGDTSFASVAPALRSGCVVAAVRSATVGMPIEPSATAPFTDGEWLLSHNGVVDRAVLSPSSAAEASVDSALLAALIFERGLDSLGATLAEVGGAAPDSRLNIMVANGSRLIATTWGDTLSILRRDDGVVLASEPYDDDPRWQDVPDRHLVEVTDNRRIEITSLKGSS